MNEKQERNLGIQATKNNNNCMVEVPEKTVTLIRGLKSMDEYEGVGALIGRLKHLSRIIDEQVEEGDEMTVDLCYWQRKILEETSHILEAQDEVIRQLKHLVGADSIGHEPEYFEAKPGYMRALRSLYTLFLDDQLFYGNSVDLSELKAWCAAHDFDFDQFASTFGEIKQKKGPQFDVGMLAEVGLVGSAEGRATA